MSCKFIFICLLFTYSLAGYTQTISLPTQESTVSVGLQAYYYEDKEKNLTIEDVSQPSFESHWKKSSSNIIAFPYTHSSTWVRFQIKNHQPKERDWILKSSYTWLNNAEIYIQKPKHAIQKYAIGNNELPIHKRFIPHPSINFPIAQPDTLTYTYYIRAHTVGTILYSLQVQRIPEFQLRIRFQESLYGVLFGIAFFIILNSFFVYLNIRDKAYLLYILYVLCALSTFSSLSGYLFFFIPLLDSKYLYHIIVLGSLVLPSVAGIAFTIAFFKLTKTNSSYYTLLKYMFWIYMILFIVSIFWQSTIQYFIYALSFSITLCVFVLLGWQNWQKGNSEARYFTLGYFSYFVLSTPTNLYYAGILPESIVTTHSVEFGLVFEMFFLAYSLADKTRSERKKAEEERRQAQEDVIRIQREANEQLESKVKTRTLQLSETNEELNQANEELNTTLELVETERKKSEALLLNILPEETARELKETGRFIPRSYEVVSILFTDFKGFTNIAQHLSPEQVIAELNNCFLAFDEICEHFGLEKIKTIGDAYMCAGGIPLRNITNPFDTVNAGLAMQAWMEQWKSKKKAENEVPWEVRIGIHTGPVVAGVIGKKKFAYDIWGDAVNIASRMESSGEIGKINISEDTYQIIKNQYACTFRGAIEAKNKGKINMYFVNNIL